MTIVNLFILGNDEKEMEELLDFICPVDMTTNFPIFLLIDPLGNGLTEIQVTLHWFGETLNFALVL